VQLSVASRSIRPRILKEHAGKFLASTDDDVASRSIRPRILKGKRDAVAKSVIDGCIPLDPTEDTERYRLETIYFYR